MINFSCGRQLTVVHPVYTPDGSVSSVSHQQKSRFSADLPTAHFLTQTRPYVSTAGAEQGKTGPVHLYCGSLDIITI